MYIDEQISHLRNIDAGVDTMLLYIIVKRLFVDLATGTQLIQLTYYLANENESM